MTLKTKKKVQYDEPKIKIEVKEEEEVWGYEVRVIADRLRIREAPSAGAKVIGLIQDKGIYRIVKDQEEWGQLKNGGWIMLKYTEKI